MTELELFRSCYIPILSSVMSNCSSIFKSESSSVLPLSASCLLLLFQRSYHRLVHLLNYFFCWQFHLIALGSWLADLRVAVHRKYGRPRSRPHLIDHIFGARRTLILLFARLQGRRKRYGHYGHGRTNSEAKRGRGQC